MIDNAGMISSLHDLLILVSVIILIVVIYAFYYSDDLILRNPFLDKRLLMRGLDKPVIWLYYDHSDVNAREWADFGARSSRALNIPFLNLCYASIVHNNKDQYRIEVIGGLAGLAEKLGGCEHLPPGLRDPISPVNEAELNWIRTAILARYGGLWLSPHSVCIKGFGALPNKVTFFGTDLDETYGGADGTDIPGFRAIWSPVPEHPLFKKWEKICYERVINKRGGEQIRGDIKWDYMALSKEFIKYGIAIDPHAECGRKKNGKRIQLEDLLATGTDGNLPFDISSHTVYVPFIWSELRDRRIFGWFLRMSEEQIMSSDVAIKYLLEK
jgi:hypothetical protein